MGSHGNDRVDALYQLPLDQFIRERDALAKDLRADGDRDAAAGIKKLAKPSVGAWAVNQLWWQHPEEFAALIEAGDCLRKAQESSRGDIGSAIESRRQCLAQLMELAEGVLEGGGHGVSRSNLQRVSQTLEALSVAHADEVEEPPGRLTGDLKPPGFEALSLFAAGEATATKEGEDLWDEAEATADRDDDSEQAREAKKLREAKHKAAMKDARKRIAELRDENAALRRKSKAAVRLFAKARREHDKAAARAEKTASALEAAQQKAEEAGWALEQAERELSDVQRHLEKLRE